MAPHEHDPVLRPGCSTGVGRATAQVLVPAGRTVSATAGRAETQVDLEHLGSHVIRPDVTGPDVTGPDVIDDCSMRAAVAEVERARGTVGTAAENAGHGEYGGVVTTRAVRRDRLEDTLATRQPGL
jgi:NAD(P)-dependent dehydrogenase (short-subunit alcohol dehydrogenase family)